MRFFKKYPDVDYQFGSNMTKESFTNLSIYADIIDQVKDDTSTYEFYNVQDGERPDIVSDRLYGSPIYGWTFFIMNDHIREQGWALSYQDFREYLTTVLPGDCLVINGTDTNTNTGITQHVMTEQFPIGTNVIGVLSGATGTVYNRNVNLGQIFVKKTNSINFTAGETINDTITGSPQHTLTIATASLAYQADHHYKNTDNNYIDIDPTTGIIPSGLTVVTHEEFLEEENENLSRIKVIRPSLIARFSSLYTETINR